MKKHIRTGVFIIASLFIFSACNSEKQETAVEETFEAQKEETIKALEDAHTRIEKALVDLEKESEELAENTSENVAESKKESKKFLEEKKENIASMLAEAKESTKDGWGDFKSKANKAYDEVDAFLEKQVENIEESAEGIKEAYSDDK